MPVPGWAGDVVAAGDSAFVVGWHHDGFGALWHVGAAGRLSPRTAPPGTPGNSGLASSDRVFQLAFASAATGLAITGTEGDRHHRGHKSPYATADGGRTWTEEDLPAAQALAWLDVHVRMQAGKGYSFSVDLSVPPRRPLYLGDKHVAVSPIGASTRIAGTMEFSGNTLRLDWRRVEAIARASRHYLGDWFQSTDELIGLIQNPWVGAGPWSPTACR